MRLAISSEGKALESQIDRRFGRCSCFLIVDMKDGKVSAQKAIENIGAMEAHGAGIRAAELMGSNRVEALITGEVGPKARAVLDKLSIKIYRASGTVADAIAMLEKGKLELMDKNSDPANPPQIKKQGRIFFPLMDRNGMDSTISDHFGHAPYFGVYDTDKGALTIIKNDLDHADREKSPIEQIQEAANPTVIFAKGIGGRAIRIIGEKGLVLKTGDCRTIGDALRDFDKLTPQAKSCGHDHGGGNHAKH